MRSLPLQMPGWGSKRRSRAALRHYKKTLNPLRTEQAQLDERYRQHQNELTEQTGRSQTTQQELATKEAEITALTAQVAAAEQQIHTLAQQLNAAEGERTIAQDTQNRLLREQREKQRQLDKLEATAQAQQEAQGTYATKIILQANLPGVCGFGGSAWTGRTPLSVGARNVSRRTFRAYRR